MYVAEDSKAILVWTFNTTHMHTPTQTHTLIISLVCVLFIQLINSFDTHLLASLPQSIMAKQTEHDPLKLITQEPSSVETLVVLSEPTSSSALKDKNAGICLSRIWINSNCHDCIMYIWAHVMRCSNMIILCFVFFSLQPSLVKWL